MSKLAAHGYRYFKVFFTPEGRAIPACSFFVDGPYEDAELEMLRLYGHMI